MRNEILTLIMFPPIFNLRTFLHYNRFSFICSELNVCVMNSWVLNLLHVCFVWFHVFSIDIHVFLLISLLVSCLFLLRVYFTPFWCMTKKGRGILVIICLFELWYVFDSWVFKFLILVYHELYVYPFPLPCLYAMPWFIVSFIA